MRLNEGQMFDGFADGFHLFESTSCFSSIHQNNNEIISKNLREMNEILLMLLYI